VDGKKFSNPSKPSSTCKPSHSHTVLAGYHVGDTIIGIKGRVGFEAAAL